MTGTRLVWRRDRLARLARFGVGVALAALVFALAWWMTDTWADAQTVCVTEDQPDCYWDGASDGNGVGLSFLDVGGDYAYVPSATVVLAVLGWGWVAAIVSTILVLVAIAWGSVPTRRRQD